jgi:hypothetical protein
MNQLFAWTAAVDATCPGLAIIGLLLFFVFLWAVPQ